ncbi:TetR/AcrR family transcriptional regulator [Streptomyces sp. A7024]|uniref:TetR/AcrR family transcriptional regulator n=1 Tax=Streptomyces coryli TaxID=1128680 RepID=A0A6G4U460_9ACTN|nr:TetR/AcrR family transcriptional regulator [Streptomyces coryli]NGN66530.1 TetR/AcrR family transcriptional regulator [Streptomyces coryli]
MASDRRTGRDARTTSIWLADPPPSSSRRRPPAGGQPAGLDLERIVAATVRLLDAEGLAKVSMRRLAAELGVTAMSVYWYVDTKDELLELALDSVHAEIRLPEDEDNGDWREQLRLLATEHRRMLVAHPWVSPLAGEYLNVGPRALAFMNAAQRAMRRSGLATEHLMGALSLLFQFTYGFGTVEGRWSERCRSTGIREDDYYGEVLSRLKGRPEYALSVSTVEARPGGSVREIRDRDFEFALDCAIAGIAAMRDGG